jgi:hypothetical protein
MSSGTQLRKTCYARYLSGVWWAIFAGREIHALSVSTLILWSIIDKKSNHKYYIIILDPQAVRVDLGNLPERIFVSALIKKPTLTWARWGTAQSRTALYISPTPCSTPVSSVTWSGAVLFRLPFRILNRFVVLLLRRSLCNRIRFRAVTDECSINSIPYMWRQCKPIRGSVAVIQLSSFGTYARTSSFRRFSSIARCSDATWDMLFRLPLDTIQRRRGSNFAIVRLPFVGRMREEVGFEEHSDDRRNWIDVL